MARKRKPDLSGTDEARERRAKEVPVARGHFPPELHDGFEIHEWKHASAILKHDFPNEWNDLLEFLREFKLRKSWIEVGGKNKSKLSKWIDQFLGQRGWIEKQFETAVVVDANKIESPTHKVDCYKNGIAFEVEWNNKDPFFDRDLNNFRLLFELRTVSVGIIFTRCDELQKVFDELGRGKSYGNSTTHISKLLPRIAGGGGGGCPLIAIGIRRKLYLENE